MRNYFSNKLLATVGTTAVLAYAAAAAFLTPLCNYSTHPACQNMCSDIANGNPEEGDCIVCCGQMGLGDTCKGNCIAHIPPCTCH